MRESNTSRKIIIGSTALKHFNVSPREPKDVDFFVTEALVEASKDDWHIIPEELFNMIPHVDGFATPDAVYTIKMSHAAWDIHWEKTIKDICFLSNFCEFLPDLYWAFHNFWKGVHGNKDFLSLKQNKDEFFTDNVKYFYDHDWLHDIVASPYDAAYKLALADGEAVLIDKEKFFNLPKSQQIRMFREEIKVIALERWCIPSGFKIHPYTAYFYSVKKTITNLTKNWATLFILENIKDILKLDNNLWFENYLDTLQKTREEHFAQSNPNKDVPPEEPKYDVNSVMKLNYIMDYYFFDIGLSLKDINHVLLKNDKETLRRFDLTVKDVVVSGDFYKTGKLILVDSAGTMYSLPFMSAFDLYNLIDRRGFRKVELKKVMVTVYE